MGNLYDFDVNRMNDYESAFKGKNQLLEMDRLALSMLQGLTEKVSNAYENFEFHEVFHAIYNFCVINMSSFYFDVLKDRLYTFKAGSEERMASQWVLYKILVSLTKMMAPVLSFTAEEIWHYIPGGQGSGVRGQENSKFHPEQVGTNSELEESVFLANFPEVEFEFIDKALEKKWAGLLKVRDEVNKALEIKRQEKFIGNSLEAKVNIYADEEDYEILADYKSFLPSFFIVSAVELFKNTALPAGSYSSPEIKDMAILVEKAPGKKCSRCWNWSESIGRNKDFDELCERCLEVLAR